MQKDKSFTLIELLVVIAVIGFLSSVVLVSLQGVKEKAGIAKALKFSQTVQHALGAYAVGWWSFETIEGGKVIDGSSYGNHGTVNGATIAPGMEELGNALSFDGVNDYVDAGSGESLATIKGFALEAWIKPTDMTGCDTDAVCAIWSNRGEEDGGDVIGIKNAGGTLWYYTFQGSWNSLTAGSVPVNTWTHVVFTWDGLKKRIYINGSQAAINDETDDLRGDLPVWIGRKGRSHGGYFDGLIDEVRIYAQALSAAEIRKHYAQGLEKRKDLVIK